MQVCCKSTGSGRSVWLGQPHLYSRVCRSSFWETGVFSAWGIDVSTAIFEMHLDWAGIRDGIHGISHPTLGSWTIMGDQGVSEWRVWTDREIKETQSFHIFTFLITLIALQVLTLSVARLPAIVDKLLGDPGWGGADDGQWEMVLPGEKDCELWTDLEAEGEICPYCGLCQSNERDNETNRREHWTGSRFASLLTSWWA